MLEGSDIMELPGARLLENICPAGQIRYFSWYNTQRKLQIESIEAI